MTYQILPAFGCFSTPSLSSELTVRGETFAASKLGTSAPILSLRTTSFSKIPTFSRQVEETHGDTILGKKAFASTWWSGVQGFKRSGKDNTYLGSEIGKGPVLKRKETNDIPI